MYDTKQIEEMVQKKRQAYRNKIYLTVLLIIPLLVVCIVIFPDYAPAIWVLGSIILTILISRIYKKYSARTLYSPEIRGRIVKEHEYNISSDGQSRIYHRGISPRANVNKKNAPLRLNGTVYLEEKNGNIVSISGLYKSHMDIYEEGDILVKYKGTKFPVVISRDVAKQPCPICGEVNEMTKDACRICGLEIVKSRIKIST